jgi:formamidopyrimidine-DNA glycosylase
MARRRQVKALLMDQRAVAGLGNIYCDEVLHRSGIHPLRIASTLEPQRIRRLHQAIRHILHAAIRASGSTIDSYLSPSGGPGSYQGRHRVYGREGEPCRKCNGAIVRIMAAGRSTHLCPKCQPVGGDS